MIYTKWVSSPVGKLFLAADGENIVGLWIAGQKYFASTLPFETFERTDLPVFLEAEHWLELYFKGLYPLPPLPSLRPSGSLFRQHVWQLLSEIPYGETTTYGALARKLQAQGISAAPQAVGGAVGHNPISILIPCHRVLGGDGHLTGYAGGILVKRFLLELEQDQ